MFVFCKKIYSNKKKMMYVKWLIIKKISLLYFVKNELKYIKMYLLKLYNVNINKENLYE